MCYEPCEDVREDAKIELSAYAYLCDHAECLHLCDRAECLDIV